MHKRTCLHDGRLVPMSGWLPRLPEDCDTGVLWDHVGCNQLACTLCHAPVRWFDHADAPPGVLRTGADVYTVDDPVAVGLLVVADACRLYACTCSIRQVYAPTMVDGDYGLDPRVTSPGPWRCAGHPVPSFPLRIDGFPIARREDAAAFVRAHAAGEVPHRSPFRGTALESVPQAYVLRTLKLPGDADWERRFCQALADAARWDDAASVARLVAVALVPGPETAPAGLLRLATAWAEAGFVPAADGDRDGAARDAAVADALGILASTDAGDSDVASQQQREALALAKAAWLAGAPCRTLPHALASVDAAWLLDHAVEAARTRPLQWTKALALTAPPRTASADDEAVVRWRRMADAVLAAIGRDFAALKGELGRRAPWLEA